MKKTLTTLALLTLLALAVTGCATTMPGEMSNEMGDTPTMTAPPMDNGMNTMAPQTEPLMKKQEMAPAMPEESTPMMDEGGDKMMK